MRNLIYILLLLVVAGCGYTTSLQSDLEEAKRLLDSDPGAALSKLNGLDVSDAGDSATLARWALLYSEALVANNISAPNDTIVGIAVDYYGRHNCAEEYRLASQLKTMLASISGGDELASALYVQKEKEFMLYKERCRRDRYVAFGLLMLLIAGGVIAWMRQRLRLQSARNDALMAEVSGLKCQIDARSKDVTRLETTLHGLLENRFAFIDSLCQTYYESQGTKSERKLIADKVKAEIDAVRNDSFPEMERAVNECRGRMLERVKAAMPEVKADDYRLLVYIASGLSSRTICLLLDESIDVIYKRKSRLKARIKAAMPDFETEFPGIF